MTNLNNRELLVLRLKGVTYVPKIGNLGPTIEADGPNKGLAKIKSLRKVEDGAVLEATSNTGTYAGQTFEAFIPSSMIEIMQFRPTAQDEPAGDPT